jgi:hypothetical protein
VIDMPFAPGTEVEVIMSPKRKDGAEFKQAWDRVCLETRRQLVAKTIADEEIRQEVDDYRAGR